MRKLLNQGWLAHRREEHRRGRGFYADSSKPKATAFDVLVVSDGSFYENLLRTAMNRLRHDNAKYNIGHTPPSADNLLDVLIGGQPDLMVVRPSANGCSSCSWPQLQTVFTLVNKPSLYLACNANCADAPVPHGSDVGALVTYIRSVASPGPGRT